MATTKRRKQATAGTPSRSNAPEQTPDVDRPTLAAPLMLNQDDSASESAAQLATENHEPQPMPAFAAERSDSVPTAADHLLPPSSATAASPSPSPAAERATFVRRRALALAGIVLIAAVAAFLANRAFTSPAASTPAPVFPAATAAPTPTARPTPAATAAPVGVANPTATPAPQAGVVAPSSGIACSEIAGLPVFAGATCTDQDRDSDDGVVKLENTYVAAAPADEVRRFYEGAFGQNGWTLGKFKYDLNLGQRRVQIEVETEQQPNGTITTVQLTEHGASAPAGTTCAPIAGLPALPNATCIKFDTDQDDGVFKTKNTYSTTASPENVWHLYESALTQSGWAGQEFQYNLQQGLKRIELNVEAQQEVSGNVTKFKIAEK
jgi:hypothetical protein